jgi:hypothetical protein
MEELLYNLPLLLNHLIVVSVAPAISTIPIAPAISTILVTSANSALPVAPAISTILVTSAISTILVTSAISAVPVAPAISAILVSPAIPVECAAVPAGTFPERKATRTTVRLETRATAITIFTAIAAAPIGAKASGISGISNSRSGRIRLNRECGLSSEHGNERDDGEIELHSYMAYNEQSAGLEFAIQAVHKPDVDCVCEKSERYVSEKCCCYSQRQLCERL